jgi:hypothetical protein
MQEGLPLPSAAPQVAGFAYKLKLMDVSADCFPTFDLTTVFVEHSSPPRRAEADHVAGDDLWKKRFRN